MKPRLRQSATAVWLVVVLTLSAWLAWVAGHAATGPEVVVWSWPDAFLDAVRVPQDVLADRRPDAAVEAGLADVDRVLDAGRPTAELAMGAAVYLARPQQRCPLDAVKLRRADRVYASVLESADLPAATVEEWSRAHVPGSPNLFDPRWDGRRDQLAALAAKLEPEEVCWWRMRACLLFRWDRDRGVAACRQNWGEVLDECARHDPENALYDYLAALNLWSSSARNDRRSATGGEFLEIEDAERFSAGVARFERGQRKRLLAVGEEGFSALAEFLPRTRMRRTAQGLEACDGFYPWTALLLGWELCNWQKARWNADKQEDDPIAAAAIMRQTLHLSDQVEAAGESSYVRYRSDLCGREGAAALCEMAATHPEVVSPGEFPELKVREIDLRVRGEVFCAAMDEWNAFDGDLEGAAVRPRVLAAVSSQLAIAFLLVITAAALLAVRVLGSPRQPPARLGPVRHAVVWLSVFGVTFVLLGLAPAGKIGDRAAAWLVTGLLWGGVLAGIVGLVVAAVRRRSIRFQFGLRSLFGVTLLVAMALAAAQMLGLEAQQFLTIPVDVVIPPRSMNGLGSISGAIIAGKGAWLRSWTQWNAHAGMYVTVDAALVAVGLWYAIRARDGDASWRARWAGLFRCVGNSALGAAACCLLIYLTLAPAYVRAVEAVYQHRIDVVRQWPNHPAAAVARAGEIEADPARMESARLRAAP